jgi:hypothetical protein
VSLTAGYMACVQVTRRCRACSSVSTPRALSKHRAMPAPPNGHSDAPAQSISQAYRERISYQCQRALEIDEGRAAHGHRGAPLCWRAIVGKIENGIEAWSRAVSGEDVPLCV